MNSWFLDFGVSASAVLLFPSSFANRKSTIVDFRFRTSESAVSLFPYVRTSQVGDGRFPISGLRQFAISKLLSGWWKIGTRDSVIWKLRLGHRKSGFGLFLPYLTSPPVLPTSDFLSILISGFRIEMIHDLISVVCSLHWGTRTVDPLLPATYNVLVVSLEFHGFTPPFGNLISSTEIQ